MPFAYCLIRPEPVYRREAFEAGLLAAGYTLRTAANGLTEHGNVMVGWNRYGAQAVLVDRFEAAGGTYLSAENGYLGPGGVSPHHMEPRSIYALARGYHNDAGQVVTGVEDRWARLDLLLQPWRAVGGHVLVCPNRPFGAPGRIMPQNWAQDVAGRLAKLTKREIRIRPHPGNNPPAKPLADDLAGAWCAVIWSSSAGVHALVAGIPVICEAPYWICRPASFLSGLSSIEEMEPPDSGSYRLRLAALQRLAWGQFGVEEIASGYAFTSVLRREAQSQIAPVT